MIRKITGKVVEAGIISVVVDVGGVGYLVRTSVSGAKYKVGCEITLHTYLAVRETAMDLYGFALSDELVMFELLITLPKIGPKSAMQIMSQADLEILKKSIVTEDATYLSKMSGIGKKSAEKIVAGLKDKIEDMGGAEMSAGGAGGQSGDSGQNASDVIDALIALGYQQRDARDAVQKLSSKNPQILQDTKTAIKEALKSLGS